MTALRRDYVCGIFNIALQRVGLRDEIVVGLPRVGSAHEFPAVVVLLFVLFVLTVLMLCSRCAVSRCQERLRALDAALDQPAVRQSRAAGIASLDEVSMLGLVRAASIGGSACRGLVVLRAVDHRFMTDVSTAPQEELRVVARRS